MQMKWMLNTVVLIGMAALSGAAAQGQAGAPAQEQSSDSAQGQAGAPAQEQTGAPAQGKTSAPAERRTDIGISVYETFTSSTTGHGAVQTPSNSAGGMFELRHIVNSLVGFEITYAYNPANQTLAPNAGACGYVCNNPPTKITAGGNEVALDWVASHKFGSLRPFVVGGMGFFIAYTNYYPSSPPYNFYGSNTVVRPAFVYGGGVDWNVGPRFGLRFQYRGNAYKAPNVSAIFPATGAWTQTKEPMAGVYYRF